ncbi:MAG TPA: nucleotidyl transferase AbiEii/AbiGii toxin family protein [Vicinamibacterales bacterium]|nr:nucleotidyl transferase AbiEii/AbiGii toxin family protein [Vicinamibacterales bacterium]
MSALADALGAAASILTASGRSWAVVGALAVSARTEPRFTRDIDIAVAVADDTDAETVVRSFSARHYTVFSLVEQDAAGRLATARLSGVSPGGEASVILDLLFASSGIEREVAREAELLTVLPGIDVPVARAGHLLAMKVLARSEARPQDAADIQALLKILDAEERARALEAARLIVARGFGRGKELQTELAALLA